MDSTGTKNNARFMAVILLLAGWLAIAPEARAQDYAQVLNLSGSSVVNG